ncbi:hypothetical protein BGX27_001722 [Mortierella sp. AM989]|nr:hypothetical protein BGX27_001722 [Mortierella sp. AM989]
MPSQSSATTLRKRAGSSSRDTSTQQTDVTSSRNANKEQLKTSRSPIELISDHPAIMPVAPPSKSKALGAADSTTTSSSTSLSPSVTHRILHILLKPFYFLLFVILHLGHELVISARSMKAYVQVFFLPHIFPTSPGVVRVLRKDLGTDLTKKPQHLAVILPAASLSEEEEEEWHSRVSQLAQWSVASGIKCLSIMRTDSLIPEHFELLQERIDFEMKEFYKEERNVPVARVRTLRPVEDSVHVVTHKAGVSSVEDLQKKLGYDLDVVILAERDGHDRLAANVRALGDAALQKDIQSQDITVKFLDRQLSVELSEPELLIVFKDDLDLSSYPPWHIRLTEIFHHPDQYIIPQYTMFLQALHRYAKCEQRFGK